MPDLDWRTMRVKRATVLEGAQAPPGVWWNDSNTVNTVLKGSREVYSWVYQDLVAFNRPGSWTSYVAEEDLFGLVLDPEPESNEFGVVSP